MRIEGKVVLITGASEGIGAACAAAFRERGARLSLTARSEEKLLAVGGSDALITAGDITAPEVQEQVVARTVERYGGVDILVNNAGMGLYGTVSNVPLAHARKLMELNFFAPLALIQLVVPHMKRRGGGTVVNVSSIAGQITLPWFTLYSVSKFALLSLTDGLRMELKRDGIHAITVCPGYVKTRFQEHAMGGGPPRSVRNARPFAITAEKCAKAIVRGVERDARTVVTPRVGWALVAIARLFPSLLDSQLARVNEQREAVE